MPYEDRWNMRRRPFDGDPGALTFPVSDESSIQVYAKPGYKLFIETMWHGDYQQVPVDPEEVRDLIEALGEALEYVEAER